MHVIVNVGGNLGFWNDFNGHLLSLQLSFLHLRNTGVPKMPSPNLTSKFIFISEMLGESEVLVESGDRLGLRYGSLIGLHRAVPTRQCRLYMLGRRRRRKRALEEAPRRDREHVAARTGTIEWEKRRSRTAVLGLLRVLVFAIGVRFGAESECDGVVLRRCRGGASGGLRRVMSGFRSAETHSVLLCD